MNRQIINQISLSICAVGAQRCPGMSWVERLELVRRAGYEYIEFEHPASIALESEDVLPAIRHCGLKVWSVHGIMQSECLSPDETLRKNAVEKAFRFASRLADFAPCPLVEHYFNRFNDPAPGKRFRRSVEELYEKVSPLGFILCIETVPWKPWTDERYADSLEVADFVRSFHRADLQMTFDVNHSNIHEDVIQAARNTAGLVKNIHVSDNHGQCEEHLPPGEGIIDFLTAFHALRSNGYNGPCNLEFGFKDCPPSVEMLRAVREKMEKMLFAER